MGLPDLLASSSSICVRKSWQLWHGCSLFYVEDKHGKTKKHGCSHQLFMFRSKCPSSSSSRAWKLHLRASRSTPKPSQVEQQDAEARKTEVSDVYAAAAADADAAEFSSSEDFNYVWKLTVGSVGGASLIKYGSILFPEITRPSILQALLMIGTPVAVSVFLLIKQSIVESQSQDSL